jgi:hypothetical protein
MFASHREEITLRLKAELEEAERQLRDAPPHELVEARRRYRHILRTFTRLVVDGILPEE